MRRLPHPVILFLLVALAYWPVVHCGFVWDDDDYVTQNPVLRTVGGLWRIWLEPTSLPQYYPLVHTTFWLEFRLWGADPLGYHLVNVALHFTGSLLFLRLLQRLGVGVALLAAAVFAVHPVHVESVAWVTERKNVLSLVCMLAAALQWLRWHEQGRRRAWWFGTAWFVGALLAKTVVAPLPAALLVIRWWQSGRVTRREVLSLLPWFGLGIALGLCTVWLEATHVRAAGAAWQLQGAERLLVAGRASWFYLGTLLWPVGLCFNYPRWQLDPAAALQVLTVAAAVAVPLVAIAFRRRLGRGPAAALLIFGGMLVPALGFFDVYPFRYSYVADHFQYHASLAALVLIAAGAARLTRTLPRHVAHGLAAAALALLAVQSSLLVRNYTDLETSWRAVLQQNPTSMLALVNLGGLLLDRGETEAAREYVERCLELHPDNYESLGNMATIAHRANDLVTARRYYRASLAARPDNAVALSNFAQLELQEGHHREALAMARQAVALEPDLYAARVGLVQVAAAAAEWTLCVEHANWVLQRTPDAVATRLLAADALLRLGQADRAMQNAGAILRQHPDQVQARDLLARALAAFLVREPAANARARVLAICASGGIDGAALLPQIAAEFRRLGRPAHADALLR